MKKLTSLILSLASISAIPSSAGTLIPYEFKDGQVISADTLNDLFDSIRRSAEGFSNISELVGEWSCTTYDLSGQTPTNNTPGSAFNFDAAIGLYSVDQTWTFSNGGKTLVMDKVLVGGLQKNYTGGCGNAPLGPTGVSYTAGMFGPFLGLAGVTPGCNNSNAFVLDIRRLGPYNFIAPAGQSVIACQQASHPPISPSGLKASSSSSGVNLSWTANTDSITGYKVLKKMSGIYVEIASTTTNAYSDSSGAKGDMYRIKAYNGQGSSTSSAASLAE
jgi:hypothetical protein